MPLQAEVTEDAPENTWAAHDALRKSYYEDSLALGEAARRLSLVLLGSLPSGDEKIVRLREQLAKQMFGKGHLFECIMESPFAAPTVVHFADDHVPDPDTVFVGEGSCAVTLTPWSCPLRPEVYSADKAKHYINNRADATEWLSRLSHKSLACNCHYSASECWAWLLRESFENTFGDTVDEDALSETEDAELDLDDDWSLEDECEISQWHSAGRDEIDASPGDDTVPAHVPWPGSWILMVQTIRGLQQPVFWEVYSGCARMTGAFHDEGIRCAPPVDAADNPEYNLLNPVFLAVVIGLLGAHLVDLLHLAPPCSSFSVILNGCPRTRLRTKQRPGGIDGLNLKQAQQVRVGNALAETAAMLIKAQHAAGNNFSRWSSRHAHL